MSDSNYNRNLLPYRNYASGLRAGKAQMHTLALKAFDQWLTQKGFNASQRQEALLEIRTLLGENPAQTQR